VGACPHSQEQALSGVLITGEALIDLAVSHDSRVAAHPGGGPFNVARTVGRLGQPVGYLGAVSTDRFGQDLLRQLGEDRVNVDNVMLTDAPTTLALAELDHKGVASYRFYAEGTSAPNLTADGVAPPATPASLYVGTLGLVFEPLATTLETIVTQCPTGTLVALDPNCRPHAISDSTSYRERLERLLHRADVIKVSSEDLAWLAPNRDEIDATRSMLVRDEAVGLITLGAEGAVIVTRREAIRIQTPEATVVDTIGAGDAFMGAFLAHWSAKGLGRDDLRQLQSLREATEFACEIAAMTCSRQGADPPRMAVC
jgi:fructokinase